MTRIIRMKADRRGSLGDGRYRDFAEGETYVESENTGPDDTVSPFLADQFVGAGDAVEVDASDAPVKTATTTAEIGATRDDDTAEKAAAEKADDSSDDLDEKTGDELRDIAKDLDIEGRSKLTTNDALIAAIRTARAEKADDAE